MEVLDFAHNSMGFLVSHISFCRRFCVPEQGSVVFQFWPDALSYHYGGAGFVYHEISGREQTFVYSFNNVFIDHWTAHRCRRLDPGHSSYRNRSVRIDYDGVLWQKGEVCKFKVIAYICNVNLKYEFMITRILKLQDASSESIFLWGARQTGKSTLLKMLFPDVLIVDLLKSDVYAKYQRRPSLLREELMMTADGSGPVIIDEIQKIPALLDEVHWLIANKNLRFILSGSSARKLRRSGANLLGGRAIRTFLYPFVSAEIPDFDLFKACKNGMIPRHYLINNPEQRLQAYIGDYLQEEIKEEALVRKLGVFTRFLEVAAFSSGEVLNYSKIATDSGVSSVTVKEYFSILEETLIGYVVPAYRQQKKRRLVQASKFYFFDVGVYNHLRHQNNPVPGTAEFGKSFEHLIIQELKAWLGYTESHEKLTYWKTATGLEVDAVVGDARIAIEIKATRNISYAETKGLRTFQEEHPDAILIAVTLDERPRKLGSVEVFPATDFLQRLWTHKVPLLQKEKLP